MAEWTFAQSDPADELALLHFFSMNKRLGDKTIEFRITVREYATPNHLHMRFFAEADMQKRIAVAGTLTKVDWINPHIVVYVDGRGEDGKAESWVFESNPPAWFRRVGVARADFAKAMGQTVKVEGVRAKDKTLYGYLQKITFADGNSLELANGFDAK